MIKGLFLTGPGRRSAACRWRFSVQSLGDHVVSVALGPPEDVVDACGVSFQACLEHAHACFGQGLLLLVCNPLYKKSFDQYSMPCPMCSLLPDLPVAAQDFKRTFAKPELTDAEMQVIC